MIKGFDAEECSMALKGIYEEFKKMKDSESVKVKATDHAHHFMTCLAGLMQLGLYEDEIVEMLKRDDFGDDECRSVLKYVYIDCKRKQDAMERKKIAEDTIKDVCDSLGHLLNRVYGEYKTKHQPDEPA
jgi:hypothetical protein